MVRRLPRTEKRPLVDHLKELRTRLMISGLAFVSCSVVAYAFHEQLIGFLQSPLNDTLYFTSPGGGFNFVLKVSILAGLLVSLPILIYHGLRFVEPVLPRHEHIKVAKFLIASVGLLIVGVSFGYFAALPAALHFLSQFGGENLEALIGVNEYLNFVMAYLIGFGVLFQIPLVMLIINRFRPLQPSGLARGFKAIVPGAFFMGAVLTPTPDPVNQSLMAGPIVVMYAIAIGLVAIVHRQNKAKYGRQQAAIAPILIPSETILAASAMSEADHQPEEKPTISAVVPKPVGSIRPIWRDITPL